MCDSLSLSLSVVCVWVGVNLTLSCVIFSPCLASLCTHTHALSLSLSVCVLCVCVCDYVTMTPSLSLSSLHVLRLCVQAEAIRKKRENPQFRQADLERDAEVTAQEGKREKQLFLRQLDELHTVSLLFLHVCL